MFQKFYIIKQLRHKQSDSELFDVKCSILEQLAESKFFTELVLGTKHPPLKAPSEKHNVA